MDSLKFHEVLDKYSPSNKGDSSHSIGVSFIKTCYNFYLRLFLYECLCTMKYIITY